MFNRRQFLTHTLKGSSLVALNAMVPQFVARTAQAAAPGKDNILVVLEMTGGNDGLNTVIPYADDLYHKARPTLRQTKDEVIRLDDHVGLHSGMQGFRPMWEQGSWRSCRASATRIRSARTSRRWTSGSRPIPTGTITTGWLGRAAAETDRPARAACRSCTSARAACRWPLAGAPGGGAVTVNDQNSFRLELGGGKAEQQKARRRLLDGPGRAGARRGGRPGVVRAAAAGANADGGRDPARAAGRARTPCRGRAAASAQKLQLIAGLIAKGFGTRIFYVSLDGFDTHANQGPAHAACWPTWPTRSAASSRR